MVSSLSPLYHQQTKNLLVPPGRNVGHLNCREEPDS